ncbi:MAG TPA: TraR/DksA C4-type zinc finger protein [Chloroflexota bacterium]|nr:TraR/DksA C4-type zinc finger protein [Chloroflexota bacterium]
MMTQISRELESALLRERQSLRKSAQLSGESARALSDSAADEGTVSGEQADVASTMVDEEIDLAMETAAREKLVEINAALRRLKDGTYGVCKYCGQPIQIDRLRAIPWTTVCVACATKRSTGLD